MNTINENINYVYLYLQIMSTKTRKTRSAENDYDPEIPLDYRDSDKVF